jgi:hypothetical protein
MLLLRICSLTLASSLLTLAQPGIGAKYGARDPMACPSTKEPTSGPPSADQARKYLQCHRENVFNGGLYLLGDIVLEVGKGVPYNQYDQYSRPGDADASSPIYPIRGNLKSYQCFILKNYPAGKNCTMYDESKATGYCYRTSFGDWTCNMSGVKSMGTNGLPPPR